MGGWILTTDLKEALPTTAAWGQAVNPYKKWLRINSRLFFLPDDHLNKQMYAYGAIKF
jgi:hypothetical protein